MKYKKLGRTGIDVGVVGLGAEYLERESKDTVVSVVNYAFENGVNYIDLFMASPDVRDSFGYALKDKRNKFLIAGHLGSILRNSQYSRSRNKMLCKKYYDDLLIRLKTDYIDILMLHYVEQTDDYEKVMGSGGLLELAKRFQKEGKARFIGMSSHNMPVALEAVNNGYIDVLMFPINPVFDTLPGDIGPDAIWQDNSYKEAVETPDKFVLKRNELYHACAVEGVGLVVMKPYAGGKLFIKDNPSNIVLTPVQCLNYALSQPGVCTVVPGCKNVEEMKAALAFLDASAEEKDFSTIDVNSIWKLRGSCMYCNHCLPCPEELDIGLITRMIDTAEYGSVNDVILEYEELSAKASDCTECGVCVKRCPFGVDIIANIMRAKDVFGN